MTFLKRLFSYLINPRSGIWRFSADAEEIEPRKVPWKGIFNPPFVLGSLIVIFLIVIVWFGPKFASYDPYITSRSVPSYYDSENRVMVRPPFLPSSVYPLGTDRFGNDILSLLFYGARVTLISCLYITAGRVLLGLILGGIAGWYEGSRFDRIMMRTSAVIASIPLLLSAMLMILALDIHKGVWVFVVSLSVLGWTEIAQIVRGEFIRIKEMLYVEAARALGLTRMQIIIRHALPNVLSYLMSISFLEMGSVLLIMAELGFLGLFVGGGSRFMSDPLNPVIVQISEIPEWGAMVAQGTPYIRTYPYMVMGPAAAFFIAIVGLNAFGEGLRRIFDRWPFSTAFILKKRMLLVIGAFVAVSIFIFQKTNAQVSYQQVAASFSEQGALARLEELKIYNSITRGEDSPVVDYLIERMREYEVEPGWSETLTSTHYYPISAEIVRPAQEPHLVVGTRGYFKFQNEFSFLTEGCAGSGSQQADLMILGGRDHSAVDFFAPAEGRIVLMLDEDISAGTLRAAVKSGVEGLLLISDQEPPLTSQYQVHPERVESRCPEGEIPVFRISEATARRIAAEARLDWDVLGRQIEEEQFILDLDLDTVMSLDLAEPELVSVPNVVGFIGGYDFDHADEIVVIYTTFDGLGLSDYGQQTIPEDDLDRIAALLEIMKTWHDNKLDPRRSVQFVIWGGEGLQEPFYQMIYGLFENNKLAAKVPTNMNPYINTNPVKPAIWVEIGDLSADTGTLVYSLQSTDYLQQIFRQAAQAARVEVEPGFPPRGGVNSGLPQLYIWEEASQTPTAVPDNQNFASKGVVLNRTLIQLLRDMKN
ncbi:MAG: ABC transporter permease subunit [Anaerolineales bacterium]